MMNTRLTTAMLVLAILANLPVSAQVDLSGWWAKKLHQDNSTSQEPVDFLGIPLNENGRAKALSYNIAALSVTERQCQMYTPFYTQTGPFGLQIWSEADPITQKMVAWKIGGFIDRDTTTIWMDGRPRLSKNAPHSHGGFTTGVWEGETLTAYTTHFKLGDIRRHHGFSSDEAAITNHIVRHGDLLTIFALLEDPVYLAEPYAMTANFKLDPYANLLPLSACEPIEELPYLHENPGKVPHYLPGKNPFVNEITQTRNVPLEAVLGGPETMYPEFRKKIKDQYVMPPPCRNNCGGPPNVQPAARNPQAGDPPSRNRPASDGSGDRPQR